MKLKNSAKSVQQLLSRTSQLLRSTDKKVSQYGSQLTVSV